MCEIDVTNQFVLLIIKCTCQYNILKIALKKKRMILKSDYLKRNVSVEYIVVEVILIVALTTRIHKGIAITFILSGYNLCKITMITWMP